MRRDHWQVCGELRPCTCQIRPAHALSRSTRHPSWPTWFHKRELEGIEMPTHHWQWGDVLHMWSHNTLGNLWHTWRRRKGAFSGHWSAFLGATGSPTPKLLVRMLQSRRLNQSPALILTGSVCLPCFRPRACLRGWEYVELAVLASSLKTVARVSCLHLQK